MESNFVETMQNAALCILKSIWRIIKLPYGCWIAAAKRLAAKLENSPMDIDSSSSRWPFLSFLKALILDFVIDGLSFLAYPVGIIMVIYEQTQAYYFIFWSMVTSLIVVYVIPVSFAIIRDVIVICLLPFNKYLSWASKPAQQLDLDVHNHDKA